MRGWAGSPHFGEKTTEGDVALGYGIMRVGDPASTELFIMSFKIRARGTQRMSRRLIFQGNFFAQWAVRCWCRDGWHRQVQKGMGQIDSPHVGTVRGEEAGAGGERTQQNRWVLLPGEMPGR